jgi:hypothetical protein
MTNAEKALERRYRDAIYLVDLFNKEAEDLHAQVTGAERSRDRYLAEAEDLAAAIDTLRGRA